MWAPLKVKPLAWFTGSFDGPYFDGPPGTLEVSANPASIPRQRRWKELEDMPQKARRRWKWLTSVEVR